MALEAAMFGSFLFVFFGSSLKIVKPTFFKLHKILNSQSQNSFIGFSR